MIRPLARWLARFAPATNAKVEVAAARPLGPGLGVYVIDVDGRRIVLAAGQHAMCVLATYPAPKRDVPEGQASTAV